MVKNKRILVSGGAGSIGSELVRQLAPYNKIFILDINETSTFDLSEELSQMGYWVKPRVGDIRDKETIRDLFEDFKPQIIFHAAAYKHVSPMELYPEEAIKTNILGTHNLLHEAGKWECLEKFVFISTDKAVNSMSIMGASKRVGEIMVRNKGKNFITVRFGNVLGSRGSVIPIWQNQFDKNKAITVTDSKMERYFMTIPQACELVIKAAELGKGGEIFILDMGKPINVLDLAKKIINESGEEKKINIIGIRPGEILEEKLMTQEEERIAIKKDKFYIINGQNWS